MNVPKTTIDLPFSPEDVRMGHHLGNAIAGYRDGDFKRSAEGMVEAVRAFQAAAEEIARLRDALEEVRLFILDDIPEGALVVINKLGLPASPPPDRGADRG